MKFEAGSLECERRRGLGVSHFYLAATIKRYFEELGV
jgi:hypothetical protein